MMALIGSNIRHATYRKMRGVTLLELMIVLVIIGIIVAFAYPNYKDFTDRARRNEAKAMLLEIAQNQERFYLQNNRYGTLVELGGKRHFLISGTASVVGHETHHRDDVVRQAQESWKNVNSLMDEGLRFAIREGGRTVGAGVVTKINE